MLKLRKYFTAISILLISVHLNSAFRNSMDISIEEARELVSHVNNAKNWNKGCSGSCDTRTFRCKFTKNFNESFEAPVYVLLIANELFKSEEPLNRVFNRKPYPIDLTVRHKLLGIISGKEMPFGNPELKGWLPQSFETLKTNFTLQDQFQTKNITYLKEQELDELPVYNKLFIVIHGFNSNPSYLSGIIQNLHKSGDKNQAIIAVDWEKGAYYKGDCWKPIECPYKYAAIHTGIVGRELAVLLYMLMSKNKLKASQVHFIGHSLGAHMAHYTAEHLMNIEFETGSDFGKFGRITGLDPAARYFQEIKGSHLVTNDASFVDIIHTSIGNGGISDASKGRLGMSKSVGHVDFFPNGGEKHPQCNNGAIYCWHSIAIEFMEFSLRRQTNETQLVSCKCDNFSNLDFCKQKDGLDERSILGLQAEQRPGRENQFLEIGKSLELVYEGDVSSKL